MKIRNLIQSVLRVCYPDLCVKCSGVLVGEEKFFCGECLRNFPVTGYCFLEDHPLRRRLELRFHVQKAASYLYYNKPDGPAKYLVHEIKYRKNEALGRWAGVRMAEDLLPSGFFEGMDCLVPVPLHWKRERERGFNQAAVLAQSVSAVTGIPVIERALCRRVATEQQALRSREERSKNVRDAFSIEDRHVFEGKHVLLIDDVLTTGSTLEACARALSSCENVRVSVLALASTE